MRAIVSKAPSRSGWLNAGGTPLDDRAAGLHIDLGELKLDVTVLRDTSTVFGAEFRVLVGIEAMAEAGSQYEWVAQLLPVVE